MQLQYNYRLYKLRTVNYRLWHVHVQPHNKRKVLATF